MDSGDSRVHCALRPRRRAGSVRLIVGRSERTVKRFAIISLGVVILALVVLLGGAFQASSRRTRAVTIKYGDTKAEVERRLGSATMVTPFSPLWRTNAVAALLCDTAETWAYASHVDLRSQFPWLRFRLFLPDPEDIAVEYNRSGRVVRVTVPPTKP